MRSVLNELEVWYELYRLETRYWREVDCNGGRNAHDFYRPDGVFRIGKNCFAGRDCIKLYYQWRESHCHHTDLKAHSTEPDQTADSRRV